MPLSELELDPESDELELEEPESEPLESEPAFDPLFSPLSDEENSLLPSSFPPDSPEPAPRLLP